MVRNTFKTAVLFVILVLSGLTAVQAQPRKMLYLQNFDNAPYHFGFLLGVNFMDYTLITKPYYQNNIDTDISNIPLSQGSEAEFQSFQILNAESITKPGFSVGIIGDLRMGRYFNLRFSPTLSLSSKFVRCTTRINGVKDQIYESHDRLATFLEFPLHVKYRSKRYNNVGAYLIAGFNPKFYVASATKKRVDGIPNLVQTSSADIAAEFGAGYDIYNQWFKMGIEIKMSLGLINVLRPDVVFEDYLYNAPFNKIRNKQLQLVLTFE